MKVKVLLAIILFVFAGRINAQSTLTAGDIIFTGYNGIPASGTPDTFKFVLLVPISSGTTIYFTERGYQGGSTWQASGTTEGTISWVSGSALAIGTEVVINGLGASAATVNGAANGTVATVLGGNVTSGLSLSNAGDEIIAFQGGAGDPTSGAVTFIAGINWALSCGTTTDAGWNGAGCTYGPQTSAMPPFLTGGTNAFLAGTAGATPNNDHGRFNCVGAPYSSVAALRAAIMNKSNWVFSNTGITVYNMLTTCTYYATCSNPTITTNPSNSSVCVTANTTFTVAATGATGYQWQVNTGSGFVDITNGGVYSNATTTTLTITGATAGMNGYLYRCVASNGACSSTSTQATLTVSNPVITALSQTNVSCNGGNNGAAAVNAASGGVSPYTYNWTPGNPNGDGTVIVSGLTAGVWTCTTTDNIGCTATRTFTITQPPAISVTANSQTNVACFGGSNGAASINTPTGGAGGYTYNWTPGNPTGDGTVSVTGLVAGSWTCNVTDANACTATRTFNITSPTAITVTPASQTNVACFGGSNGAASINTPTGGAGGYTYNWTPGNPTGDGTVSVTGLTAGSWTCTVTDANSCTATQTFNITAPSAIIVTPASQTNVACFGGSTGAASINTPTGGAGGYTYNWTPGNPTGDGTVSVTGLTAGSWTCTVTDANSCTATQTFNITSPTALVVTPLSQTNVACFGGSNGAASVIVSGGTTTYSYNWTPGNPTGDGTASVTGLVAGTWTCNVTDANSCTTSQTFNITSPTALVVTPLSQTNVACLGGSTGAASIIVSGGTTTYSYNWTPGNPTGDGTASVTGLTAGSWTCTVTDANSCTATQTFNVTSPTALVVTPAIQTNVSCNGGANGAASINTPTGGAGGYTYNWTPGNPTGDGTVSVTGLTAGSWTCTVTDANSCTATATFNITQPTALSASISSTPSACNASSGTATVSGVTGGAGGYTYSWAPSGGTGSSATGLAIGSYTCTITDANGCQITRTVAVAGTTPPTLTQAAQTNVSCFGGSNGSATVNDATGGAGGYTYNWTPGNPTGDGTVSVTGLTAGSWTCIVTDANSCTATSIFNITSPTAITVTAASQTNVACNGGSTGAAGINTPAGGAGGYTYNWTPGNPTGDGTVSVTGLTAGSWTCTVTDANSCTATQTFNITAPSAIIVTPAIQTNVACFGGSNGAAVINTPTGGAGGYTYNWTPGNPTGDGTTSVSGLTAGTWTCTVTDANGCTRTQGFNITSPTALVVSAASQTNVACNGGNNGAASINTPTGGAGGYTYNWTPGNPAGDGTVSVTGLSAGSWTCTVTDANNCTATQTFNITAPSAITVTPASQTNVACNGGSTGAASINIPTGGAGGYTYDWTPGNPTGDDTRSVTGLTAGSWTCTVTDANSCTATATFNITAPTALSLTTSTTTNVSCFGGSNGTARVNPATGGAGGYTYDWTPGNPVGDGTTSVNSLTAGVWTCTVTDANSCTTTATFDITEPASALTLTSAGKTDPSCSGGNNGTATVNAASGGAGGYTYNWAPGNPSGDGTTSVSGLTAGVWTCTVTDANSCTSSVTFVLNSPSALGLTPSSQTNVACFGGNTGSATVNIATGGTLPYVYDWTPGNPTGDGGRTVTGLTAGVWTCTVIDAHNCTKTQTFNITSPSAISVTAASQTNVTCSGLSNGAASINTPTGGAGGFSYDWAPGTPTGDGTVSVTGLTAGTWTCNVTDANSCTATATFNITAISAVTVSAASQTNVACFGGSNGAASINTPTGGATPYTYNWTPGNPTGDGTVSVTGLTAGTWTCNVTDAGGCTATQTFNITSPSAIIVTAASQTNVACNGGSTGAASINTPTGGAGGFTYNWSPGNPTGDGTVSVTGLTAGTWTCTVTDANSCTASQTFNITAPSALIVTAASQTNVACNGGSTGAASINTPTGGAGGYTYNWTPGNPTGDGTRSVTGLTAGSWTCTVTDANSCTASQTFNITAPTAISVTPASQTNVACNGGSTGAASINTPTGGAGGYTYNWTPGNPTGDGTVSVTGLTAGSWTCTVTDANACTASQTFNITAPTAISVTPASQTNVACNGGSTGAASINTPTGGAGGFTYNWTPGNPTGDGTVSVTGLTAGSWTCTVTDANSCTASATFNITAPTALAITPISQTNVSCFGGNNGAASVTVSGGVSGYTYNWTPGNPTGDGTASVTGLSAGAWTCTVTDANSCTASATFNITSPSALTVTPLSQTNVSCFGGSNGAASVTVSGGALGYSYNWTPGNPTGDGTASVTGLTAGSWTCTVTDANSCTSVATFNITAPSVLSVTPASQTNVSCFGGNNGAASINTPTGGAGGYTYNWTPGNPTGDGTLSVTGLSAGNWTCTVTDANGCTATQTFTLTSPVQLQATIPTQTNVSCNGGTNGSLTASVSGGVTSYTYDWSGTPTGDGTTTITDLAAGGYTVVVTDANSCTVSASATVTEPATLSASSSGNNVLCNGGTTTVMVTATGGTGPYTGDGTYTVSAGTYNYTVTDNNGCTATTSITITEPTALSASSTGDNVLCNGGTTTVTVTATGGTGPYTGTGTFTETAGTHSYTVTDANGCTATTSVTITEPTALSASSGGDNVLCNGGTTTVTVTATGGTGPYTGTGTFTETAGTHSYTVTDANGCTATTSVTITEPTALSASSTGDNVLCNGGTTTVTVTATGGTGPYTGTGTFTETAGTYTYTVTDANGCTATTTITITEPTVLSASSGGDNVLCNGGTTTVTVTATGGTGPYTGDGTYTVSAGTYNYTVTDANGCTATTSITITEPAVLSASSGGDNVLCNGGTTTVTVTATGGTGPYTGTGTFTETAGTHSYTVTDANGCTATTSVTITEPTALSATSTGDDVLCNGGTTTITVTATGGTGPYTGTGTFTETAGTHTYTVTDANGCTTTTSITITEPAVLSASSTGDNVLCNGGTTAVTVSASGGTAPYTGEGTYTVSAGTYTYTVTDANGCTATTSITITEPAVLSASSTGDNVLCNGGTSTVTVTATGGTGPYTGTGTFTETAGTYTYTVTDANGCTATTSITITEPAVLSASSTGDNVLCNGGTTTVTVTATGGTGPYTGTGTFTETAGTYTYTVTDDNGCTTTTTITIAEPVVLTASSTSTNILCNGGTATVTVSASGGTSPYTGEGTYTVSAGTYTYTVTDANGCTATTTITVTEPDLLVANATATTIVCNGGTATVTVTATGGTAPYAGEGSFTVSAGTYSYTVTDDNGCTATTTITVAEPAVLNTQLQTTVCAGESVTVGTTTYNTTGIYTNTLQSVNGCDSTVVLNLTVLPVMQSVFNATSCSGTYLYNGQPYTQSGTYTVLLTSAEGCDSTVTLNLVIQLPAATTVNASVCFDSTYNFNGTLVNATGTYYDTLTTAAGCDSIVILNLTVSPQLTRQETGVLCGSTGYVFYGTVLHTPGTYTHVANSVNDCDTVVTLTLTQQNLDANATVNGTTCAAVQAGATYQWYDCTTHQPIAGANAQTYTATQTGSYQCLVTVGNCSVSTNCVHVTILSVEEVTGYNYRIYPNPNSGVFTLEHDYTTTVDVVMYDILGQLVKTFRAVGNRQQLDINDLIPGVYEVVIADNATRLKTIRLVRQ